MTSSLMILNLNFQFNEFMNKTSEMCMLTNSKFLRYIFMIGLTTMMILEITSDELSMINRAGSWGTVQELRDFRT